MEDYINDRVQLEDVNHSYRQQLCVQRWESLLTPPEPFAEEPSVKSVSTMKSPNKTEVKPRGGAAPPRSERDIMEAEMLAAIESIKDISTASLNANYIIESDWNVRIKAITLL